MRFSPCLAVALFIRMAAADIPLDDATIVLGQRVGPIEKGMTLSGLKTLLGGSKVKPSKIPGAEGEEIDGARVFGGTDRELEIIFNPEGAEKEIWDVRIIGKAWRFSNGLAMGMTIEEVEKINGRPFKVSGFGWDYGGYANFEGGKLQGLVTVRFDPGGAETDGSVTGDVQVPSTSKKLRALKARVCTIEVDLR